MALHLFSFLIIDCLSSEPPFVSYNYRLIQRLFLNNRYKKQRTGGHEIPNQWTICRHATSLLLDGIDLTFIIKKVRDRQAFHAGRAPHF